VNGLFSDNKQYYAATLLENALQDGHKKAEHMKEAETSHYIRMLEVSHPLRKPVLCEAIKALNLQTGSQGLDVGCGIGLPTLLLAEAVGSTGHVTGVDISSEFLAYAEKLVDRHALNAQITLQQGSFEELLFDDQTFDWLWSADCAGYASQNSLTLFNELIRVLKPGGTLALLFWSSEKILPGYPMLEARLKATSTGIAPFKATMKPEAHYFRTLKWMQAVGLQQLRARTFVGDVQAPLSPEIRKALLALFQMRWEGAQSDVTPEDWAECQRLCSPESPDCILNLPEYYAFFTYSMFTGTVPKY
jgi:ubiquinone/menaquinone biosynthesis C-methylase UbiE